jgi:hypothetical protein
MGNGVKKEAIDSKHLKPNGLYTLEWDLKLVKKLILDRKLAPFFPGKDSANEQDSEECPICFLVSFLIPIAQIVSRSRVNLKKKC